MRGRSTLWVLVGVASIPVITIVVSVGAIRPTPIRPDDSAHAEPLSIVSQSYGWPVLPFTRQHPLRGLLRDPRIGRGSDGRTQRALHTGVDIVASNGTPVYATLTGRVSIHPLHRDTVLISDGTGRVFEYWHVVPTLTRGEAIAYVTVIGHVERPWGHVHFSERIGSTYVNPLRSRALRPYVDTQPPIIERVTFERGGYDLGRVLSGSVSVVVETWDGLALPVPPPWERARLTPAVVRWRVIHPGEKKHAPWITVHDARQALPLTPYAEVFTADTRQNRAHVAGRYRLYLARQWGTNRLAYGTYALEVSVADVRGNVATEEILFATANF